MKDLFMSLIIFALYFWVINPIFHEFGHALKLKKYEEHPTIVFYIPFYKTKISLFGVDIFFVNNKKYKNITYSISNYQNLNEDEVMEVVNGGVRNSYILLFVIFMVSILGKLFWLFILSLFGMSIYMHAKYFQKEYNDFNIKRNPREFLERNRNLSKDSEMLYENLIREYKK